MPSDVSSGGAVCITGVGLATPLGLTAEATWRGVLTGRPGMGPAPALESPAPPGSTGGQVPDLPADFSPELPREARYLRWAVRAALADAGHSYRPERCATFLGTTLHGMRAGGRYLRGGGPGELSTFLAGATLRLATSGLGLAGGSATTCSACSSGLGSVAMAATLLRSGQADLVVAGGYDAVSEYVWGGFGALRVVADGPLRPFARGRRGMKLSEGYGILILERAADAAARGKVPLATVAGWGESADAYHLTRPHPEGVGAAAAARAALERAGVGPGEIGLISAHATGTPDNDAAEAAAYRRVFGDALPGAAVVGAQEPPGPHPRGGGGGGVNPLRAGAARRGDPRDRECGVGGGGV